MYSDMLCVIKHFWLDSCDLL